MITAPVKNGTFLLQLSVDIGKIRDYKIVDTIADAVTKYNRVLVVYGSGHIISQQFILQDMFGDPIDVNFQ